MDKLIVITYDFTNDYENRAYAQVLNDINNKKEVIYTCCLDFFSFKYLGEYDVKVIKRSGEYMLLSGVYVNEDNCYTNRIMRLGHNVRKLFLSGEFKWQK